MSGGHCLHRLAAITWTEHIRIARAGNHERGSILAAIMAQFLAAVDIVHTLSWANGCIVRPREDDVNSDACAGEMVTQIRVATACALPIPEAPPVTMATAPAKARSEFWELIRIFRCY